MDNDNTAITNKIRDCLIKTIDPAKIIIFGSYARGEANADSDIDIAAITNNKATRENLIQCRVALREALRGTGLAIDFILQSAEQFDRAMRQKGSIQEAIATEGRVIYERQDEGDEEVLAVCAQTREIFEQADRKRTSVLDTLHDQVEGDLAMAKARMGLSNKEKWVTDPLVAYSRLEISAREAMNRLKLKYQGQLLDLLGMTDIPFPSLPSEQIEQMVRQLLPQPKGRSLEDQ